jgi:molecular chaperone GrpE
MMEEEKINEIESQEAAEDIVEEEDVVLKQALEAETKKAEEYLANWQRSQADLINYRRRTEKEKEEMGELIRSVMALKLLPILDDFERAIAAEPDESVDSKWAEGVKLIEKKLRSVLESEGLSCIECVGEQFDPHLHEAIKQDCGEEGKILYEVLKGYKFNDRVLRPSQVIVGSGETDDTKEE